MEVILLASDEVLEILLVLGVSFIGASVHEYVFRTEDDRQFFKNPNIWVSTIVSFIICYSVNPWISGFNPRMMLLPPLLLGLAGMDLVKRLSTPEGSSSILEYMLGFFGITNQKTEGPYGIPENPIEKEEPKEEEPPTPPPEPDPVTPNAPPEALDYSKLFESLHPSAVMPTASFEKLMTLDAMAHSLLDSICNLIVEYYVHHDTELYLRGYFTIKKNLCIMHNDMKQHQFIPLSTALKLSEILKKEIELDKVYNEITSSNRLDSLDPTSN